MPALTKEPRLGPSEVAILLGISERTLTRWVQQGRFPKPVTFGRARHWEKTTVQAWIDAARKGVQR
jgi:excisionase family DNA binding protein